MVGVGWVGSSRTTCASRSRWAGGVGPGRSVGVWSVDRGLVRRFVTVASVDDWEVRRFVTVAGIDGRDGETIRDAEAKRGQTSTAARPA